MPNRLMLIACLLTVSAPALADCDRASTALRPHLVELYSSEGCSSCPPAEQWLRSVPSSADVVPLEFHVDYWDRLGWRDRFDDPRYTARQQAIAARDGGTSIYTPQVVLDGGSWSGWYRGGHLPTAIAASAAMQLSVQTGSPLRVQVAVQRGVATGSANADSPPTTTRLQSYIALVEDGLVSQVRAGENNGVTLRHDHVVRAFAGPLPLTSTQVELPLPADLDMNHASIVGFAQNADDGKIAQVLSVPLAQCQ